MIPVPQPRVQNVRQQEHMTGVVCEDDGIEEIGVPGTCVNPEVPHARRQYGGNKEERWDEENVTMVTKRVTPQW